MCYTNYSIAIDRSDNPLEGSKAFGQNEKDEARRYALHLSEMNPNRLIYLIGQSVNLQVTLTCKNGQVFTPKWAR